MILPKPKLRASIEIDDGGKKELLLFSLKAQKFVICEHFTENKDTINDFDKIS